MAWRALEFAGRAFADVGVSNGRIFFVFLTDRASNFLTSPGRIESGSDPGPVLCLTSVESPIEILKRNYLLERDSNPYMTGDFLDRFTSCQTLLCAAY